MFNSRYSDHEMQQWHDACLNSTASGDGMCHNDAMRHNATARPNDAHTSTAKGQAEKQQSRTASAMMQMHTLKGDWASECLFDWYNG